MTDFTIQNVDAQKTSHMWTAVETRDSTTLADGSLSLLVSGHISETYASQEICHRIMRDWSSLLFGTVLRVTHIHFAFIGRGGEETETLLQTAINIGYRTIISYARERISDE